MGGIGDSRGSGPVLELVSGYPRRLWPEKLLVALQAIVDDSASEIGDRRFFLAGLVASADDWAKISDEWSAELAAPPSLTSYHAVEAQNRSGDFKNWSRRDIVSKQIRLANIVAKYRPWSFETSISREAFERHYKPNALHAISHPFQVCFYGALFAVARFHEHQGLSVPVDFIFDENNGVGEFAALTYNWVRDLHPELKRALGSTPVFRDDKQFAPLQAADMLVWHIRREHEGREPPNYFAPLNILRRNHALFPVPDEYVEKWGRTFSRLPNLAELQTKRHTRFAKRAYAARISDGLGPPDIPPELAKIFAMEGYAQDDAIQFPDQNQSGGVAALKRLIMRVQKFFRPR